VKTAGPQSQQYYTDRRRRSSSGSSSTSSSSSASIKNAGSKKVSFNKDVQTKLVEQRDVRNLPVVVEELSGLSINTSGSADPVRKDSSSSKKSKSITRFSALREAFGKTSMATRMTTLQPASI
jgi:hypothetical protein